ncbi:MAG: hypothetical protein AB1349_11800 [Elusimicrobiota bacterium]
MKNKITEDIVIKILDEVREEYNFPPVSVEYHDNAYAPFYIKNMRIYICLKAIKSTEMLKMVFRHEIGHSQFAPVSIDNTKKHIKILEQTTGISDLEIIILLLNVIYDIIVEFELVKIRSNHIEESLKPVMNKFKKIKDLNFGMNILGAFYNNFLPQDMQIEVEKEYKEISTNIVNILDSNSTLDEKVKSMAEVLIFEARRQADWLNQLRRFFAQVAELLLRNLRHISDENQPPVHIKTPTLTHRKRRYKYRSPCYYPLLFNFNRLAESFEYYLSKASRNVEIKFPDIERFQKLPELNLWNTHEPIELLELDESVSQEGILLPEITTYKFRQDIIDNESLLQRIVISADTSGSMNKELTITTIFSLIETARKYASEVAVILFANSEYFSNEFTRNYDGLMKQIYKNYGAGGADNKTTGTNIIKKLLFCTENNLIVFISDWQLFSFTKCAENDLRFLSQNNKIFTIIPDNNNDAKHYKPYELRYATIRDQSELSNFTIDFTDPIRRTL